MGKGEIMTIHIGDRVTIQDGFGAGELKLVTVTATGEHKGRPVFDYVDGAGRTRWAYHHQIRPDVMFKAADGSRHRLGGFVR